MQAYIGGYNKHIASARARYPTWLMQALPHAPHRCTGNVLTLGVTVKFGHLFPISVRDLEFLKAN